MVNPTVTGWQETWFGRFNAELIEYRDMDPAHEIAFKINYRIEYDVKKIVRNVLLQELEPLTNKDIQPLLKDIYAYLDPEAQVQLKGQRLYKAKGDLADWEKQLMVELRRLKEEKKKIEKYE